jgi:predicted nucleic acid-binding protein
MPRQLRLGGSNQYYAIDTSALVDLDERVDADYLWRAVQPLMIEGRVRTVPMVMDELEHVRPDLLRRLRPFRSQFVYNDIAQIVRLAGDYANRYRHMSRPNAVYTEADPWLLAFAKEEGLIVVTNEKPKRNRHMPDVCKKENILCRTLEEFLTLEKLP